ncbi:MAG: NCS2 family permease [Faecalibacterium sp.]|jgi:AGZA family xanthine/uracil permease-like MFS transporter|nr:NCS2 family permease [Faecalibacterium sp.]
MEQFFKLKEHGTNVKTEVAAGVTTFMTMAYILIVNAGIFSNLGTVSYGAIYIATAISAVIGTVLVGLMANLPLAMASGMGLNAFFVYTVCFSYGFTYANALVFVLIDGVVFVILTATGLRKAIFDAIPECVRTAIPAGIGLFIAFIGMQDSGLVIANESTCVTMASFNLLGGATWASIMPLFVFIAGIAIIAILSKRQVKGAVIWGILASAVLYYVLGATVPGFYAGFAASVSMNPISAFGEFFDQAFLKVFTEGFDFSTYLASHSTASLVLNFCTTSLAFCLVDMFDTMGTLYGACARGDMLTEEGEVPHMNQAMLSDAIATCTGAVCGTSTVTTFVESSAGIGEGGRTGLTSLVTAACFLVAMFLSPVASLIPSCAAAAALVYVGILMMASVKKIEWADPAVSVPAFMTMGMMVYTYSISYGIAFGIIASILINLFTGKVKEIKISTWVIGILFLAMFLLTH